ncbi:MAG: VirB3 family type IV secretion system protein [Legionella sp.]|nr:VirB3 family type IV secretion system protein [Legionella sp.]
MPKLEIPLFGGSSARPPLNRHFNIFGVDSQLFYLNVGLTLPIAFSARLSVVMIVVAALVFMVLHSVCLLITRADNQMLAIYRRHIHYRKFYSATPGIHAKMPKVKPSVPFYQGKRGLV